MPYLSLKNINKGNKVIIELESKLYKTMNEKAEFSVKILKKYAHQNQTTLRSTSDLSKLEEWLILELMKVNDINK